MKFQKDERAWSTILEYSELKDIETKKNLHLANNKLNPKFIDKVVQSQLNDKPSPARPASLTKEDKRSIHKSYKEYESEGNESYMKIHTNSSTMSKKETETVKLAQKTHYSSVGFQSNQFDKVQSI